MEALAANLAQVESGTKEPSAGAGIPREISRSTRALADAMHGECFLKQSSAREPLVEKLAANGSTIWSYVIMPNHVHLLVSLADGTHLEEWIQVLKGGSSYAINQSLNRTGKLWAKDYFERLIRDSGHFTNCAKYIRRNPEKARLNQCEYSYFASNYVLELLEKSSNFRCGS